MPTKKKWQRAMSLVPPSENIASRWFKVYDKDLYFIGDRCWFIVKNFMESDSNFKIGLPHMSTVMSLNGEVTASKIDEYGVEFTNGKQVLRVGCSQLEEKPVVGIPREEDFEELSPTIEYARNIFNLSGHNSVTGAVVVNDIGHISVVTSAMLVAIAGDVNFEMDMTADHLVLKSAIANSALVAKKDRNLFFKLEGEGYEIYSAISYSKPNISDKARSHIETLDKRELEPEPDINNVVVTVATSEFSDILPMLDKMMYDGHMEVDVHPDKMLVHVTDIGRLEFDAEIPCKATGRARFKSVSISRQMIDFLTTSQGGLTDMEMSIHLNLETKRMIMRPVKVDDTMPDAYILLAFSQHKGVKYKNNE